MADQYCTATQVKNHTISSKIVDAGWSDPTDIDTRIVEAQNVIDAMLGAYYTVPFDKGASVPPIINTTCKWLARYLILRDIMEEQVVETEDSYRILANKWKKDAEQYINGILGKDKNSIPMIIIDSNGETIERETGARSINSSTSGIGTIMTMDDALDQQVDSEHSEDPVVEEHD